MKKVAVVLGLVLVSGLAFGQTNAPAPAPDTSVDYTNLVVSAQSAKLKLADNSKIEISSSSDHRWEYTVVAIDTNNVELVAEGSKVQVAPTTSEVIAELENDPAISNGGVHLKKLREALLRLGKAKMVP